MKKSLNLLAAVALVGSTAVAPLAFAQTAPAPAQPSDPATQTPDAGTTAPSTGADTGTGTTATQPLAQNDTSSTYLTEQSETQVSANELIGNSITTGQDESIGDINDLIIEQDGRVAAAVVGVGGFLGIGEKNVALPLDKITITQNTEGDGVTLTTAETAETLKAAPEFHSLEEQADAADSTATGTDSTTTSSTGD
ncbi:PRC-barrel domain-containing protein [Pseudomonas sp. R2.Fl]|nr:PRC-barrel domain-containing protein [Pseudomonas sp. R2.Fl]